MRSLLPSSASPVSPVADEALAAARAAGLRHVHDRHPGLRRRRTGKKLRQGKRWVEQFAIEDAQGRAVHEAGTLERVRKLAIPPAWEDVWICPQAEGHLQATGRDARGRKQYRYHARWRQERDSNKYSRMVGFARALPAMRRQIAADLRLPGLSRRKVLATVVRLLETTFIRVGNEEYARSNQSYGLTTMKDRHVKIRATGVRFHFRGKSGVFHEISIHDPSSARIVRRCRDLPGQELFQYLDADGRPAAIDSSDVNQYIHELAGEEFTAKDFRTWAGTVLAALALGEIATAAATTAAAVTVAADARGARSRRSRPSNRDVARAVERVARRLGNTPSVCRKCYIHPAVVASFLDGTLKLPAAPAATGGPRAKSTSTPGVDTPIRAATSGLRVEEAAVLALLKRRASLEKGGRQLETQLRRSLRVVRRGPARRAHGAAPRTGASRRADRPGS